MPDLHLKSRGLPPEGYCCWRQSVYAQSGHSDRWEIAIGKFHAGLRERAKSKLAQKLSIFYMFGVINAKVAIYINTRCTNRILLWLTLARAGCDAIVNSDGSCGYPDF